MRSGSPGARPRGGFTLIELLVAGALSVLLAGVALAIATRTLAGWRQANDHAVASRTAQFVLGQVGADLESLVRREDENAWLVATVQPDQSGEGDADAALAGAAYFGEWSVTGVGKPGWSAPGTPGSSQCLAPAGGALAETRFGMAGVWLRFLTRVPDAGGATAELHESSTVRAVSYQIVRRRVNGASGATESTARRYTLFRSEVRPFHESARPAIRSTFGVGHSLLAPPYWDPAAVIAGSTERAGSGEAEPGGLRRPDRAQVLADNVVDFGLRLYRKRGDGTGRLVFPADTMGNASEVNRAFVLTGVPVGEVPGSPHRYVGEVRSEPADAAELLVRVLTEEGARRLEAIERGVVGPRPVRFGSDGEWWWGEALAHSVVATRWIEFRSSGQ